jgi:hypothetical protein
MNPSRYRSVCLSGLDYPLAGASSRDSDLSFLSTQS